MEAARPAATPSAAISSPAPVPAPPMLDTQSGKSGVLADTTLNLLLDTYYEYNFNSPIGRAQSAARLRRQQQQLQH